MLDLVKAVEAGLRAMPDDWDDSALHISDLGAAIEGEGCLRQVWLRINGAERKEDTPGQRFMFMQGHRIHELIPEIWTLPSGWDVEDIECAASLNGVTGRSDCVLRDDSNYRVVVDFKTVRGNAFKYLDTPKPSHVAQVQGYMLALGADAGKILYADREGQNGFLQFDVDPDTLETEHRVSQLLALPVRTVAPPMLEPKVKVRACKNDYSVYVSNPWNCSYCAYCGVSCDGAVPADSQSEGVCGKAWRGGEGKLCVEWKDGYPDRVHNSAVEQLETLMPEAK